MKPDREEKVTYYSHSRDMPFKGVYVSVQLGEILQVDKVLLLYKNLICNKFLVGLVVMHVLRKGYGMGYFEGALTRSM